MIIVIDLCAESGDLQKYEMIAQQCKDKDIVILVNNAGMMYNGYVTQQTCEQMREQALVNTYPYVILTRALLP